ncbi:MAG TPA: tRNA glutamyl-Q(34) synthetase GluQRS [Tepidisphaeraceae bacterium]
MTTRLAPSPTGALHLGNARTFLINWLLARQNGWNVLLRIEDLDGPRIKRGADLQLIDDLRWLGISWDQGPIYQSSRMATYQQATEKLLASQLAYPCICSRKEVDQSASAPHAEDGAAVYSGTCRGRFATLDEAVQAGRRNAAIRFHVPDARLTFVDRFSGEHAYAPAKDLGDFVIAKADKTPAYQLAVVVDDADMGVTHVVRGDDLLDSTPRQLLLYHALGLQQRIPNYWHLPLVIGPDGRRLAKRHGDSRLATYRAKGVTAKQVLNLLAKWCGIPSATPRSAGDLLDQFDITKVPHEPIVFDPAQL